MRFGLGIDVTKKRPPGTMKKVCSRLLEIARFLVRFNHVATCIANANPSIM
jgi:hypothetical protein